MSSSFSQNKSFEEPASGDYPNAWAAPLNGTITNIDTAFGGVTTINLTGVLAGTYALSLTQYRPVNIEFSGTVGANVVYVIPSGIGGMWSVSNTATGAFTVSFGISGGNAVSLSYNLRSLLISDRSTISFADTAPAFAAITQAEAFATAADVVVANTTEAFATAADVVVAANAANATNLTSGAVPLARLPNAAAMPGVTIQADPGGTPTGVYGDIFYFY